MEGEAGRDWKCVVGESRRDSCAETGVLVTAMRVVVVEGKCRHCGNKKKARFSHSLGLFLRLCGPCFDEDHLRTHTCVSLVAHVVLPQRARWWPINAQTGAQHTLYKSITRVFSCAYFDIGSSMSSTLSPLFLYSTPLGCLAGASCPGAGKIVTIRLQLPLSFPVSLYVRTHVYMCGTRLWRL